MDSTEELQKAFANCDTNTITSLLSQECYLDVDSRDVNHGLQTLLMQTCHIHVDSATRKDIFNKLIQLGANVNLVDGSGRTALAHACIAEKADIVELLSEFKECDVNIPDNDGNTPIIYAVRSRNVKVVTVLLDGFRNVDVNHANNKARCALIEAEAQCDSVLCKLLVSHGADVSVLNMVSLNKDVRILKQSRCPTPEALSLSPRTNRRILNTRPQKLGALITDGRITRSPISDKSPISPRSPLNGIRLLDRSNRFSRSPSCSSDKDSVAEEIPEEEVEDEDDDDDEPPSNLRSSRRNSLSLPDLREAGKPLLIKRYNERFPGTPNSSAGNSPRCGTPTSTTVIPLPRVAEEDDDMAPPAGRLDRRGSVSLPNLLDCSRSLIASQERLQEDGSDSEEEYSGIMIHALPGDRHKDTGTPCSLPPISRRSRITTSPRLGTIRRDLSPRYTVQRGGKSDSKRNNLITATLS